MVEGEKVCERACFGLILLSLVSKICEGGGRGGGELPIRA